MPEPELSLLFVRPLNQAGIRYVVSGSVAAILYGEPRLTHDVDFVVFLNERNIRQLSEIFPSSYLWAFHGKRTIQFEGENVVLAPPEYVIVRKLEFYREGGSQKHVRDIRSMLAVSGDQMNKVELEEWIRRRGLELQWT